MATVVLSFQQLAITILCSPQIVGQTDNLNEHQVGMPTAFRVSTDQPNATLPDLDCDAQRHAEYRSTYSGQPRQITLVGTSASQFLRDLRRDRVEHPCKALLGQSVAQDHSRCARTGAECGERPLQIVGLDIV